MALGTVVTLPASTIFFPNTASPASREQVRHTSAFFPRFLRRKRVMAPFRPGSTPALLAWAMVRGTPAAFAMGR